MNLKEFENKPENPFLSDILPHIKEKKNRTDYIEQGGLKMLDESTGALEPVLSVQVSTKPVDTQEFIKFYADVLDVAINLKSTGQRVLLYFLNRLEQNSDVVEFSLRDCQEECEFKSCRSVYAGLVELLEKQFIAKTMVHYKYWINPTKFFNGSRLPLIKPLLTAPKFPALPKSTDQF